MAQAVSQLPLIAEAWVRSQGSPCEICGGEVALGLDWVSSTSRSPCQYHSNSAPHSSLPHVALTRRIKRRRLGSFQKGNALSQIGWHWTETCCTLSLHDQGQEAETPDTIARFRTRLYLLPRTGAEDGDTRPCRTLGLSLLVAKCNKIANSL
jgi:hypothetical protein